MRELPRRIQTWLAKKLNSILLVIRSETENGLGPLDISQKLPDLTIEQTIQKMENLCCQVMANCWQHKEGSSTSSLKLQYQAYKEQLKVGEMVWRKNPFCNNKQKLNDCI